jgi:hypothetical protein
MDGVEQSVEIHVHITHGRHTHPSSIRAESRSNFQSINAHHGGSMMIPYRYRYNALVQYIILLANYTKEK